MLNDVKYWPLYPGPEAESGEYNQRIISHVLVFWIQNKVPEQKYYWVIQYELKVGSEVFKILIRIREKIYRILSPEEICKISRQWFKSTATSHRFVLQPDRRGERGKIFVDKLW